MLYSILFQQNYLPFSYKLILFFSFTVAAIFSLTIHEFSHAFVAHKLGDSTAKNRGRLTLNPMAHFDKIGLLCFLFLGFGWAKPVPINPYNFKNIKRDNFLVSIAGVVANFICAFVFYPLALIFLNMQSDSIPIVILSYLFVYLYQTNLVFMVFNLLPIYPLDGFNAIASQLKYSNKFVQFMYKYGSIILLFLIIVFAQTNLFSLLVYYVGYPINKFWNLIFL